MQRALTLTFLGVALLIAGSMSLAHGVRNNNPGNLRANSEYTWRGQIGVDSDGFVIFDTLANGFRAMYKNLLTYRNRYELYSVSDIIYRWAPPEHNDTAAYIARVSSMLGVKPNEHLSLAQYPALMVAMARIETGKTYSINDALAGVKLS